MHKKAIDSFTDFLNARWAFGVVLWELVTLGKYVSVVVDMLSLLKLNSIFLALFTLFLSRQMN